MSSTSPTDATLTEHAPNRRQSEKAPEAPIGPCRERGCRRQRYLNPRKVLPTTCPVPGWRGPNGPNEAPRYRVRRRGGKGGHRQPASGAVTAATAASPVSRWRSTLWAGSRSAVRAAQVLQAAGVGRVDVVVAIESESTPVSKVAPLTKGQLGPLWPPPADGAPWHCDGPRPPCPGGRQARRHW